MHSDPREIDLMFLSGVVLTGFVAIGLDWYLAQRLHLPAMSSAETMLRLRYSSARSLRGFLVFYLAARHESDAVVDKVTRVPARPLVSAAQLALALRP